MSPSMAAAALREFDSDPSAGNCTAYVAGNGEMVVELGADYRRNILIDRYDSPQDLTAAMVDAAEALHDEYENEQERLQFQEERQKRKARQEREKAFDIARETGASWFSGDDDDSGWW